MHFIITEKKESGRQKRRTARNAEEIIRKKYLNVSDSDSSDSSTEQLVTVNHKLNQDVRPASPLSLKRNCSDNEIFNGVKKVKMSTKSEEKNDITKLAFVKKFFQRDIKEKLPKLTQEVKVYFRINYLLIVCNIYIYFGKTQLLCISYCYNR